MGQSSEDRQDITTAALIPVKSFDLAKGRLADRLSTQQRSSLAKAMAKRVVRAAHPMPTFVICDDDEVAAWAESLAVQPLWSPVSGLNPSVTYGRDEVRSTFEWIVIAHADLPLATDLSWVADFDGVTIVQDRRGEGTNVMAIPTAVDFRFNYGTDSSALHQAEAERLDLALRVVDDDELGWDVDTGSDLDQLPPGTIDPDVLGADQFERAETMRQITDSATTSESETHE